MYRRTATVLAVLMIAALGACKSNPSGESAETPNQDVPTTELPAPADVDAGLIDTRWVITEINGRPVQADATDQALFLGFTADGILGGFAGVNYLNAKFERSGKKLEIGPVVTTKKAGPPELNAQEVELLKQLMLTQRYRIQDGRLELLRSDGAALSAVAGEAPEP